MDDLRDDVTDELAVRALFDDLIEQAGNPELLLHRRIALSITDEGSLYAKGNTVFVSRLWIQQLPLEAIEALLAREMGAIVNLSTTRRVLALAAARLACYFRTLLWCVGIFLLAFVSVSAAVVAFAAAFVIGHGVCHLLRRVEYRADAYAIGLVGAEALSIGLECYRLPRAWRAVEPTLFVLGYGTHPLLDARIRRLRSLPLPGRGLDAGDDEA